MKCSIFFSAVALTVLSTADGISLRKSFLSLSSKEAFTLQELLNEKCREFAQQECRRGDKRYCSKDTYARHELGTPFQKKKQWRCYLEIELDFAASGQGCVDDCGKLTNCVGTVPQYSTYHLTRDAQLKEAISTNKDKYCNKQDDSSSGDVTTTPREEPVKQSQTASGGESRTKPEASDTQAISTLQRVLDEKCKVLGQQQCSRGKQEYCSPMIFARFEVGTAAQRDRKWRCYLAQELEMSLSGQGCVDNCGNLTDCLGAVSGVSKFHLTRHHDLEITISEKKIEYCRESNVDEEEEAVSDEDGKSGSKAHLRSLEEQASPLQMLADAECVRYYARHCSEDESYCVNTLARHVDGTWKCYNEDDLDVSKDGVTCIDSCGDEVTCPGQPAPGTSGRPLAGLETFMENLKTAACRLSEHVHAH